MMTSGRCLLLLIMFSVQLLTRTKASCGFNCTRGSYCCQLRGRLSCCSPNKSFIEQYWYVLVALVVLLVMIPCLLGVCSYRKRRRQQARIVQARNLIRSANAEAFRTRNTNAFPDPLPTYEEVIRDGIPQKFQHFSKHLETTDLWQVTIEEDKNEEVEPEVPPYTVE